MKKTTLLKTVFLFSIIISNAQIIDATIDDPGDIAFVAYHDDPDGFSFVLLDDCPVGTQIRFTDNQWTGSGFESLTAEGEVLWENNTLNTLPSGTVIHIENASDNAPGISTSAGTAAEVDGGFILGITHDEIVAFTGTRSTPGTFLTIIGDTDSPGSTLSGTGLTNGSTAIHDTSVTEGYYSGPSHCTGITIEACAQQINNLSNWTFGSYNYTDDVYENIDTNNTISTNSIESEKIWYGPNPVQDNLHIKSNSIIKQIDIFNSVGQILSTTYPNTKETTINVSALNKGVFYIKTIFQNRFETTTIQKL